MLIPIRLLSTHFNRNGPSRILPDLYEAVKFCCLTTLVDLDLSGGRHRPFELNLERTSGVKRPVLYWDQVVTGELLLLRQSAVSPKLLTDVTLAYRSA